MEFRHELVDTDESPHRAERVAAGIDADGEHAHRLSPGPERPDRRAEVLGGQRTDVLAMGVEESDQNDLPTLAREADGAAVLIDQPEAGQRARVLDAPSLEGGRGSAGRGRKEGRGEHCDHKAVAHRRTVALASPAGYIGVYERGRNRVRRVVVALTMLCALAAAGQAAAGNYKVFLGEQARPPAGTPKGATLDMFLPGKVTVKVGDSITFSSATFHTVSIGGKPTPIFVPVGTSAGSSIRCGCS